MCMCLFRELHGKFGDKKISPVPFGCVDGNLLIVPGTKGYDSHFRISDKSLHLLISVSHLRQGIKIVQYSTAQHNSWDDLESRLF